MMRLVSYALVLFVCASPAHAGFVGLAIGALTKFAAGGILQAFIVRTGMSIVFSQLAKLARGKSRVPGISTDVTTNGGVTPQKIPVGRYATAGQFVAPAMSYGSAGGTPLAYLVYDIAVSAAARATLNRVIINDSYVTLGATLANWGKAVTGDLAGYAWVDYRDGTQTTAHAGLLAAFGGAGTRPWQSDMIGRGVAEAILRFRYDRQRMNSLPVVMFELLGIPLYDPRADSSVGGSGAQRWANPATWTQTENLVVIIYNIMRGIRLEDGSIWGGNTPAEDLPLANWMAGMNECDVPVAITAGGTEPQYRGGYEISVDTQPHEVIAELKKACAAEMAEFGGVWKIRVGPPALPVYFFTDADIMFNAPEELDPFPGLEDTYNGVEASYPEPESLWKPKDAPARYNATWEAEDDGQRLVASLQFPACPYQTQVQRLMAALAAENRRWRTHQLALQPSAAILEALDTVSWTSARNGYASKAFEVKSITDTLMNARQFLTIRECDPADYTPVLDLPVTYAPVGLAPRAPQTVPGFAVAPLSIVSLDWEDTRPGILMTWTASEIEDARGIQWEIRAAADPTAVVAGSHAAVAAGELRIVSGILPSTVYEVRAEPIADRPTTFTGWTTVTTPGLTYSVDWLDLAGNLRADWISAGKMNARYLEVTEMLEINSVTGAFSLGKTSAFDMSLDGIFMGRTDDGGSTGFGFNVGKDIGGVPQFLQFTSVDGFRVVNARHFVSGISAPAPVIITTSQTVTLPVGTKVIDLDLIGAGGGGKGGTGAGGGTGANGGSGGATTVQLWDGAVNTGISWTSAGGAGATTTVVSDTGQSGANSRLGVGGIGYRRATGGNATGYGAGGAGGGDTYSSGLGGVNSIGQVSTNYDVSGYANPKLVVVIGAAGVGGGTGRKGGDGSPGRVQYRARTLQLTPANVLPLKPTFTGTMSKAAGAAVTFPNYGAGLWVLNVQGGAGGVLNLGVVETHLDGSFVRLFDGCTATFISDKTPIDLAASTLAIVYEYQFYKLSEWA